LRPTRTGVNGAIAIEIADADLSSERGAASVVGLLDAYARDPMGGGVPLPDDVRARLGPDLRERVARGAAAVLLALLGGEAVGVAVCFVGYSTFRGRPLLNLHDLAVLPAARGAGVGRALLAGVAAKARAFGCCKVTLEVREDNATARRLYARAGFVDSAPAGARTRTLFLEQGV
jgi:ribosomal protein S18 acetylase RimI-like enzyme